MNKVQKITQVEPKTETGETSFATTINYLGSEEFSKRVCRMIRRPPPGRLVDGIRIFWSVVQASRKEKRLLLSSSWGSLHPELLAAAFIGLWPQHLRPTIYLLGCMWEPDDGLRGKFEKLVLRLADGAIDRYIVQSTEELTIFPSIWQVSPDKVRFCPFFFSFTEKDLRKVGQPLPGDHIFAGGNSLRDYEPLVEVARRMPERKFIFATTLLDGRTDLPPNIEASYVSHERFVELMVSSAVTIVPIQLGLRRAAGQQTYLNAMRFGKPTIVTDTLGVRDHICHKETGLIVDGTAEEYVDALNWVFNPDNQEKVARLMKAAQSDVVGRFSFDRHIECLLAVLDEEL